MKENMLKLKNDLKKLAIEIREAKNQRNESFRNGMVTMAGTFQYDVLLDEEVFH